MIDSLRFDVLEIPFKVAFRHASASRDETSSVWVEAVTASGVTGRGESCPRPYVTGETIESVRAFVLGFEAEIRREVTDLSSLRRWMATRITELDRNPAAWCAIELALLEAFAREAGQTMEQFLSLPPLAGQFRYTAVLGDAPAAAFRASAEQYKQFGFSDFKVKLSGDVKRDSEKLGVLRSWGSSVRIRADANNAWESVAAAVEALDALKFPFFAIEEPVRSKQYADLARVSAKGGCPIVLDETMLRASQIAELPGAPEAWIINLRVSKMGGLLRSLALVHDARQAGIGIIVGAQVGETSLLTRAALPVARAAGDRLVAQEGAFGTFLLERDICDPPLMFGAGGVLEVSRYPSLSAPGFGV